MRYAPGVLLSNFKETPDIEILEVEGDLVKVRYLHPSQHGFECWRERVWLRKAYRIIGRNLDKKYLEMFL